MGTSQDPIGALQVRQEPRLEKSLPTNIKLENHFLLEGRTELHLKD